MRTICQNLPDVIFIPNLTCLNLFPLHILLLSLQCIRGNIFLPLIYLHQTPHSWSPSLVHLEQVLSLFTSCGSSSTLDTPRPSRFLDVQRVWAASKDSADKKSSRTQVSLAFVRFARLLRLSVQDVLQFFRLSTNSLQNIQHFVS